MYKLYDIRRHLMLRSCRAPEKQGAVRGEDNVSMSAVPGRSMWGAVWSRFFCVPKESRAYWLQVWRIRGRVPYDLWIGQRRVLHHEAYQRLSLLRTRAILRAGVGGGLAQGLGRGALGQSPAIWLLSWQLAASIDLSPFTKISTRPSFAKAYLGHEDPPKPPCWPTVSVSPSVAGRGTNTLRIQTAIIFSAEGKTAVRS